MLPFPAVKHLNIFEAHVSDLVSSLESLSEDTLAFEAVEPASRRCIVPAVPLSTHRTNYSIFQQQRLKGMARVLTSPVRVMHQARRRPAAKPGHGQCIGHVSAVMRGFKDQPTISRLNRSRTMARYSQPSSAHRYVCRTSRLHSVRWS